MTRVFTTGQVARVFSVNINTVIKWFDEGKLKGFRLPRSNERRIYRESVTEFMKFHDISPDLLRVYDEQKSAGRGRGRGPRKAVAPVEVVASGAELRIFPRKPVELVGALEAPEGLKSGVIIRNLSMGGAYLVGYANPAKLIPEEFDLKMTTDSGSVLASRCQIVHVRREPDQTFAFGCRFTQIDPGSLQSYLAAI